MKKTPTKDYSRYPYVSNYPPLKAWLDQHEARCMWQVPSQQPDHETGEFPNGHLYPASYIECYLFATGRLAVVIVHAEKHGWDIFTAGPSGEIAATLADASDRLGLTVRA